MGKFTGAIIGAALLTVGVVTGNPGLALAGGNMLIASTVALLFAPSMPKPDAAQSQKKESRPVRTKGIGTRRVFGKAMFWDTNQNGETVDVLAFLSGRSHAMRQPYLNDDKVTITAGVVQELGDGAYDTGKVLAGFNLGLTTETAFPAVVSALPGVWTEDHRGDGITSGYLIKKPVKSKNYLKTYPQADNTTLSAVFDMSYLFDPRDPSMDAYDPETWVKSDPLLDNPVLGLLWYLITDRGVDYDTQILPVIDYWISAADHCDEPVALKGGSTERRYRCCILFDMTSEPADIISEILKTFDGWYAEDSLGRYIVYSGRYYEPTVTIGPAQIVNARHQGFVEDEDFVNEIAITYVSADHDYNEPDATPWTDEVDIAERGKVNSTNFSPQTPSHSQNRRLAKRFMARQNAVDRGTITTNYDGMSVVGERFIWLEHVEAGTSFYTGPAEIVTSPEKDMQTLGVSFDWVSVSPSIDSWNAATEEGEPAPIEGRIAPAPLPAPTITTATAELGDGGSTARIRITVDGFDRDDITWFARWRITSDPSWNEQEYSDIDPGPSAVLLTTLVALDVSVDVQVAYSVGDGRVSPWSALESVSTSTAGLAPSPPSMLAFTGETIDTVSLEARAPLGPNFDYLRFYSDVDGTFAGAVDISGDIVIAPGAMAAFTETDIEAGPRYYWAQAFNAAGSPSAETGPILASVGAFILTGGALPTGATLTRASAGYYRDASGVWASAATDVARFDHRWNGSAWVASGLLVEAAATNLALQSRDLSNASWAKAGGSATATRFTEDSSTGNHYCRQTFVYVSGSTYTASVEASEVSGSPKRYLTLNLGAGAFGGVTPAAKFDLSTGTVTHTSGSGGVVAAIEAAGPGKWLCSITATASASISTVADVRLHDVGTTSSLTYTGTGTGALDISEIQVEIGTRPTSRIPTTTTTVTRAADIVTLDWAGRNVADGSINVLYTFGNGTTQAGTMTVASGVANIPTPLNRSAVARIDRT